MFKPSIKPNSGISNVKVTNTIIHVLPDFGTSLLEHLDSMAIMPISIKSIFIRDTIFRIGPKRINPKTYYTSLKRDIHDTGHSRILVVKKLPSVLSPGSSMIVDYTKTIEGLNSMRGSMSDKVVLLFLFEQIKNEILDINRSPIMKSDIRPNHVVVASAKWKTNGILDLLQGLRKISKKDINLSYSTFGEWFLINTIEEHPILIPVMGYDKSRIVVYPSSLTKASGRLPDQPEKMLTIEPGIEGAGDKLSSDIVDTIKSDGTDYIVDSDQVSKILKKLKIKNPNVESAISQYVEKKISESTKGKKNTTVSQSEIEIEIVKAINYSLTGKEKSEIDPAKTIALLSGSDTKSVNMTLPNNFPNVAVSPNSAVNITKISGVNRQEFEFTENIKPIIETLFKSLSSKKKYPIQVVRIKTTQNNDSRNEYTTFEVTLKNLNGGDNKQYTVSLNIPSIVNDKYFRLNGKDYMMSTQQYLKPIVKDKPADIRFLTHYNMTRMNIVNIRHNIVDYKALISKIQSKYPELIQDSQSDKTGITYIKFYNGLEIWPNDHDMFARDDNRAYTVDGGKVFVEFGNDDKIESKNGITETIFDLIFTTLIDKYPKEASKTSTAPYIQTYTVGVKIPVIVLVWQQLGLLDALVKMNIDYEIANDAPVGSTVSIPLSDGTSLWLKPSSYRQELLSNGLLAFQRNNKFKLNVNDLNNRESAAASINKKYGNRTYDKLDLAAETMIDPTTEKLLKDEGLPTDYIGVISGPMLDRLFNDKPSHPNDLSTMRARQAEVMSELIYNELGMAYNRYQTEVNRFNNKEAKIFLDQNYIIDNLIGKHPNSKFKGGAVIDYSDLYSPVDELIQASKVIRTGKGGIPNTRAFRKEQRVLHDSHIGNISAHATPEYANVGIVNHHCLGAQISADGIYGGKIDDTKNNPWSSVSINEALTPLQNQMNSDRLIMATTHSGQKVPISNSEVPLVGTGAEAMVAQLSSSKFIHNSSMNGKVISKVKDSHITVEYDNGKLETFDIADRKALISGNTNILISMKSLNVGDKFKAHESITWSSNFKDNQLANGKNMVMAVASRMGKNFEDGYAISKKISKETKVEKLHRIPIMVDPGVEIVNLLTKIGTETSVTDILLEFKYASSIDDFLQSHDILGDFSDSDAAIEQTSNTIKTTSPGGTLVDIRITLNTIKNIDPVIMGAWKSQNTRLKNKIKALSANAVNDKEKHTGNIYRDVLVVGKHKFGGTAYEGALIEFFLVEEQELSFGDKVAGRAGTKGVVTDVYDSAKSDYSGDIDIFISPLSILGRKNTVVVKELWIGKIMYHLPEILSKSAKSSNMDKTRSMIMQVYKILDTTHSKSNVEEIGRKLNSLNNQQLYKQISNKQIKFNILYPPFTNIGFKEIKEAAALLDIPLMERVYNSELDVWSKEKVPVGINYISRMEQFSDDKESTRSTAGYKSLTGQPHKGKKKQGGQSIGGMDTFAFLTYDSPEILQELMGGRSDNFQAKVKMLNDLRTSGRTKLEDLPTSQGKTRKNLDVFMISMGLVT